MNPGTGTSQEPIADGRYRLVSVLGAGGMATVYRAYDERLRVYRAIKVLAPHLSANRTIQIRFESEAQTMARLHHPAIVTVHDVGSDGDRSYIVMEMVEGGSLLDWLEQNGSMPSRLAGDVTVQLLRALEVAHKRGVIHRDIKPHNVLVTAEGDPKLTDFGIAHVADEHARNLTRTGSVMGTWGFMAPEQRTSARRVDGRADVYAVGATLFTLVTTKMPVDLFACDMDDEMLRGISPALAEVIRTATRYKPEERYADAASMAAELARVVEELAPVPAGTARLGLTDEERERVRTRPPPSATAPSVSTQVPEPGSPGTMVPDTGGGGETFAVEEVDDPLSAPVDTGPVGVAEVEAQGTDGLPGFTLYSDGADESAASVTTEAETAPKKGRGGLFAGLALLAVAGIGLAVTTPWSPEPLPEPATVEPVGVDAVPVPEPIEEPPAEPVVEEPDVIDAASVPAPVEAVPAPKPVAPAPRPIAAPVEATPEPVAPAPKAVSAPAPAPVEAAPEPTPEAAAAASGRVVVTGDATDVWLVSGSVRLKVPSSSVPVGSYSIDAAFGGAPAPAGTVTVRDGSTHKLICVAAFAKCNAS